MARETVEYIIPTDLDDIPDGTTYKKMSDTEKTKLTGIEEGADANIGEEFTTAEQTKLTGIEDSAKDDQTGLEMQTAIVGIADADRVLVGSEPQSGEKKVYGIHINASGYQEFDQEDTPEP